MKKDRKNDKRAKTTKSYHVTFEVETFYTPHGLRDLAAEYGVIEGNKEDEVEPVVTPTTANVTLSCVQWSLTVDRVQCTR